VTIVPWILGAVGLLVAAAYLLPRHVRVARSREIPVAPAALWELVARPRAWPRWSPWNARDPQMSITYDGPEAGRGARWAWKSKSQGDGEMVFTEAIEPSRLTYSLQIVGMGPASPGTFTLEPVDASRTRVTWTMTADMGNTPMGRYFGFFAMGRMLGRDFDAGLASLDRLVTGAAR
jgi:uncharacterized protein YndB with AHSA1/START domain